MKKNDVRQPEISKAADGVSPTGIEPVFHA